MKKLVALMLVLSVTQAAAAGMVISEWMYSGVNGEFVEFTNTGPNPVDMTGWSFDDDSGLPGSTILSAFGVVDPGESVILTEATVGAFTTAWGGLPGVSVIGGNTNNLGRNDAINLYNASNVLVDTLAYGDQTYPGTVRTQNKSCNIPAADYGYTVVQTTWTLATVGDAYGSWASSGGDVASPGQVPEPATLALLAMGAISLIRRRH
jgi:predicted extracellular nuclease